MTKAKFLSIVLIVLVALLIIPNISKAATEYTYEDTAQGITWSYELDDSGNVVNLICKTSSKQGAVTIPSTIEGKTVISIGNTKNNYSWYASAFADHAGITEVTIPDTVAIIGYRAFYNCAGLKKVTMTDNVTKIGGEAFAKCSGLTELTLSKNITTIGSAAFQGCKGLKKMTIPNGMSSLSANIFNGCVGLTEITIPENISTIENYAFNGCTGISKIVLPDNVNNIGEGVFEGCAGLKEVTLSNNLTTIGKTAFAGCTGLAKISIPDSVTTVGSEAFANCRGLKEVTLSKGITSIAYYTFHNCSGLTSVVIPDSVTTIDDDNNWGFGAFEGCTNLKKVLIPDTVASIGKDTFGGCSKLTIYGNDDQESKRYAEENEISFDYIKNWDKAESGADITPPTVESIEVTYASVMNYDRDANKNLYMVPAGAKLVINAKFNEAIEGTTVPTLTIKFGDGENVKVTEGVAAGSVITYTYTIKNTDKGIMTTVDFSGGNIKDGAGNAATLSCPELSIQYDSLYGDYVYANGTATNPDTGNNSNTGNNDNTGTGSESKPGEDAGANEGTGTGTGSGIETDKGTGTESGSGSGTGTTGGTETDKGSGTTSGGKKDPTEATGKLPQTGLGMGLTLAIISLIVGCVFTYFKYNKLKEI